MDEFRIYDLSLNDIEVKSLFDSGRYKNDGVLETENDDNLILYYSFNENTGKMVHDNRKFGKDGEIHYANFFDDGINVTLTEGTDYVRKNKEYIINGDINGRI